MKGESVLRAVRDKSYACALAVHRARPGVGVSLYILRYVEAIKQTLTPDEAPP